MACTLQISNIHDHQPIFLELPALVLGTGSQLKSIPVLAEARERAERLQIEEAIRKTSCEPHRMVSGAGHDAMILAEKIPAAMIFLRTPDGISHSPMESVAVEDVAKAIECGIYLLDQFASSSKFQSRTCRA